MKIALKDIAIIRTGIFAKPTKNGDLVYLQSKHFDEDGTLKHALYPDLKAEGINDNHLLREGDVLFASKGSKNFATFFESNNQPAVASTTFFVIRLQKDYGKKVLPEFLVWFLNHTNTQKFLKGKARGTSLASISKSVLEDLEIFIPALEMQKMVIQISQLRNKEVRLKNQIDTLREQQIQRQLLNVLK